ncbi:MAG: S8 family serine peptidase [Flavobacterium sp.]|uniref:S8 family serine peptidase n=1 Tax=Flavobacterium sp. TaxID=239 RepID=UPI0022C8E23E|nr:S8 family serine peptidase [Flavobacterium sp.]MCZ8197164.1 S8 family serine peptidase [Flavobacterium sp.]
MKKYILFSLLIISFTAIAQEDAWVYFNGKPNAQTFLDNPLTMLTQRSLDRRTAQGIALDIMDVPVHQPYINQVEAATGITVLAKSKWMNCVHIRGNTLQNIQALSSLTFVSSIDYANTNLNRPGANSTQVEKRKINKTMETLVNFNYGNSANQIQMLNGHLLHQQNFTGQGKIIAVMDGGFPGVDTAAPFARLRDNNKILGGYDYVNRDPNFYTGISHGTLVLSTMGGYVDGQLVGTAPDAAYYLFITEDGANEEPLEESLWVEAAEEADRLGVDILNTSLGYTEFDNPAYNHTYADMNGVTNFSTRGVNAAFSRGIISVNSAGNSGNSAWFYVSSPADAINALTVGAVNASGNIASFSSRGFETSSYIKPDVAAQGVASVLSNTNGTIATANGTSFSSPITAGMVASLWQALPAKTNAELIQLIKESSSQYTNPDYEKGYGIPNFNQALINGTLGFVSNESKDFNIYPNPVTNYFSVQLPNSIENVSISVYNSLGQNVLENKLSNSNSKISLEGFESGVYVYKIEANNFSKTGKISKN